MSGREVECYIGREFVGTVRKKGDKRFEAYDADDNPLGVFPDGEKAHNAILADRLRLAN